ncbi:12039_t:CDS:2, partial [Gigaspora margarita]
RLDKTHKYEGIVRANALTKRKQIQENEHDKTLNQTWQNDKKKLKFSDMGNNKENAFYNNEKVEFELNALKDTTNIWNNSSMEYSGEDNETIQKPPTNIIEPEPMPNTSTQGEVNDDTP